MLEWSLHQNQRSSVQPSAHQPSAQPSAQLTPDPADATRVEVVVGHAREREGVRPIMGTASKGELISAGEGKTFRFGENRITVKVHADDTDNKYEIVELAVAPGFDAPTHLHQRTEHAYNVLEGELEFKLSEQTVIGRTGDLVSVPIGVPHAFSNPTKAWAKMLEIRIPGEMEKMLEERAQAFPPGTPIDRERMDAIMRRYDVITAPPDAT